MPFRELSTDASSALSPEFEIDVDNVRLVPEPGGALALAALAALWRLRSRRRRRGP